MKKTFSFLLLSLFAVFSWTSCQQMYDNETYSLMQGTATPSLLPESLRTADAARLSVELTKQAGEGEMTDLTIRSTQVSLELTQAVATEQYFARQTEVSANSTATKSAEETAVAQANATGTAVANITNTAIVKENATSTAIAKATSTAEWQNSVYAQATNSEIDRENRSKENSLWFSTWAPRVFLTVLFIIGVVGAFVLGKALWQARWIIAAHLGVIRWGPDGKPYFIAPAFDDDGIIEGITLVDADKMLSSGVSILPGKTKEVDQGVSENTRLVIASGAQTISRQLAANVGSGNNGSSSNRPQSARAPSVANLPQQASLPVPPADVKILVLPPNDDRISSWVDDAMSAIIDADSSDVDSGDVD